MALPSTTTSFPLQKPSPPPQAAVSSLPVLQQRIPSHLKEKILCLEVMGVDAGRALTRNPSLRDASLDSVHSVVSFLQAKAGLLPDDLPKILGMCPGILTSDVSLDLSPSLRFLADDLGVPDRLLRRVLVKNPRLLISSAADQLRPALTFLRRLGFSDLRALAQNDSILLVSSVERTLIPKLRFLEEALGLTRAEAAAMVVRCPALFTFSVENNFRPKMEFFAGEMRRDVAELKEFPQYFAFSLEKRIKPRHEEVAKRGLQNDIPLSLMLKTTDDEFREFIEHNNSTTVG